MRKRAAALFLTVFAWTAPVEAAAGRRAVLEARLSVEILAPAAR